MKHWFNPEGVQVKTKGVIPVLLLILLLGVGVCVVTGDDIVLGITYFPSNSIGANENINIKVVVSNQSGKLVGNQIDFLFDDSTLGFLNPTTTNTDINGEAITTFTATSKGGVGNLTIKVHYFDGGIEQYKNETRSIQVIPYPDLIIVETKDLATDSNKKWVVANGNDKARVSVWAINTTADPDYYIPNLRVDFSLNNTETGTITPVSVVTDGNGRANSVFTTKTKSGTAQITGKVFYSPSSYVTNSTLLFIDHDTPYNYDSPTYPDYKSEVEVGTNTTIAVKMLDRWGNVIENRREVYESRTPEQVTLSVEGSPSGVLESSAARFWDEDNQVQNITQSVNSTGIISVLMRMDQKPGINYILIDPSVTTIQDRYIQITGESIGEPFAIEASVNPPGVAGNNPWVYTGTNPDADLLKFTLTYKVLDKYGNGLQLKPIDIVILAGAEREDLTITTNSTGYAAFEYGPRSMAIRDVVVTATPTDNQTISVLSLLDFISTNPEDMVITANPQSMASRDANPAAKSEIKAKVINAAGDGVAGEVVNFTIENEDYPETYTIVLHPSFKDGVNSNITDANGYATVTFLPGSFTQVFGDDNYDSTATGTCDVKATWHNQSGGYVDKSVELAWKNYPYLNVLTFLDSETVNVTDTVNVTIRLVGDGYKMEAKPIDVIICHDRSWSMLYDMPDRMVSAMDAAQAFVMSTSSGKDRTGLVSFGNPGKTDLLNSSFKKLLGRDDTSGWYTWWPFSYYNEDLNYLQNHYPGNGRTYSDYATVDTAPLLDWDKNNVTTAIERLVPWGYTPMRYGLYKSIKEFSAYHRTDAVKAIVLITDGDYNYYGDPLARGNGYTPAGKSITSYGFNTHDYTIFDDITDQNLSKESDENGIKIFTIAFSSDITTDTNDTLKILAEGTGGQHYIAPTGSDLLTIYSLIAGQLREEAGVNTEVFADFGTMEVNGEELAGNQVLTYIASVPSSTNTSRFYSKNLTTSYGYIDHTDDWASTMRLPFNIGTMYLNDIWEGIMTFRVDQPGNIKLFNHSQEAIFFDSPDGPQILTLPDTYLFASVLETSAPGYGEFTETEFNVTNPSGTIYEWTWVREYSGDQPLKEQYFISVDGGKSWTQVGERILEAEEARTEKVGYFKYDVRNMIPPGGGPVTVDFRLTGRAIDAPSPRRVQNQTVFNQSGIYILLE